MPDMLTVEGVDVGVGVGVGVGVPVGVGVGVDVGVGVGVGVAVPPCTNTVTMFSAGRPTTSWLFVESKEKFCEEPPSAIMPRTLLEAVIGPTVPPLPRA